MIKWWLVAALALVASGALMLADKTEALFNGNGKPVVASMLKAQSSATSMTNTLQTDVNAGASSPSAERADSDTFAKAINGWIAELSGRQGFEAWKEGATWTSYPLGPGMHGWIVIIERDGKEAGYLVVQASQEDGKLLLSEYGTGERPLFSTNTLYQSLIRQDIIDISYDRSKLKLNKVYVSPFKAYWTVERPDTVDGNDQAGTQKSAKHSIRVLDAKTGELLPLTGEDSAELEPLTQQSVTDSQRDRSAGLSEDSVIGSALTAAYDPYAQLAWLDHDPLDIRDAEQLIDRLQKNKLTFVYRQTEPPLLYPFSTNGYHKWKQGATYFAIYQEGARYIPFSQFDAQGGFYKVE